MKALTRIALALSVTLTASLSIADREIEAQDFSGWMDDYDSLVFVEEKNAFIFFNESARGKYDKVQLESVSVYASTAEQDIGIAEEASAYLSDGISQLLENQGLLVSEAGPGVLRLNVAITGVEKSKEDLKAYNFIPVSAVFRAAQAATGNVATYIDAMFEAEMRDSVSGERVAAVVKKGISETEKRSGDELSFDDVKPTLDQWLAQYKETLESFMAQQREQGTADPG